MKDPHPVPLPPASPGGRAIARGARQRAASPLRITPRRFEGLRELAAALDAFTLRRRASRY